MVNIKIVLIMVFSLLAMSGMAFAQSNDVIFHINDSRNNETDLCMFHRTNILDAKPCRSDNGNNVFQFDMNSKVGPIKQGEDQCLGFNKARLNNWSIGSKIAIVDCEDLKFQRIEWAANSDATVFTTTNSGGDKQFCLAISPRFNQSIALGDCSRPETLPIWRLVSSN